MRGLKVSLWVSAVLFLLGAVGLFLPDAAWVSIVECFGGQSTDAAFSPMGEYMFRVALAMCFFVGLYFVALAKHPKKYPVLVPFTGLALVLLGVVCVVSGLIAGMPVAWILGDSLSCLVLGVLIVAFWKKSTRV